MSWLFGMKSNPPPTPIGDDSTIPATSGGEGQPPTKDDQQKGQQTYKQDSRMAYSFDSSALERAARAAKDLEKSKHSKEALELAKLQEQTRQMEMQAQIKEFEASMENTKVEQRRVAEEERRKTIQEEAKQHKAKLDYQDQLARKRFMDEQQVQDENARRRLMEEQRMQEENLRKQEESIKRQEALRRSTMERELEMKHKYDMERVMAEVKARGVVERENREIHLEQLKATEAEKRQTILESIKARSSVFNAFITDPQKIVSAVAGLSLLAVGFYTSKRGTGLLARYIEARIGKPALVRETSRITPLETLKYPIKTFKQIAFRPKDPLGGVVLNPQLEARLRDIAITTKNTKRNNGLYRNVMFCGPPGTGKTMFAKTLAHHSAMDYAIMTGGDVKPLGRDGVSSIHKVFDWAANSKRGLLLFVDEADAFLRKRSTENISEDMRATLNAFLYRTGENSNKFMLVIASNQPEQFDWAVNDRIDEIVEFELPGLEERKRMLLTYFKKYIADAALSKSRSSRLKLASFDWVEKCNHVAERTHGLSGREIAKLCSRWQASAYASQDGVLTEQMMEEKVDEVMKEHGKKMKWLDMERRKIAAQMVELNEQADRATALSG